MGVDGVDVTAAARSGIGLACLPKRMTSDVPVEPSFTITGGARVRAAEEFTTVPCVARVCLTLLARTCSSSLESMFNATLRSMFVGGLVGGVVMSATKTT